MQKVFLFEETKEMTRILDETYDDVMAVLKAKNPEAETLLDDEFFSLLHDLLALVKMNHIYCKRLSCEETPTRFLALRIGDKKS